MTHIKNYAKLGYSPSRILAETNNRLAGQNRGVTHGQISGLTNRNHIRLCMRVRLPYKSKPNNYTESCMVNVADRWRERNVWYPGRSVRYVLKGITIIVR